MKDLEANSGIVDDQQLQGRVLVDIPQKIHIVTPTLVQPYEWDPQSFRRECVIPPDQLRQLKDMPGWARQVPESPPSPPCTFMLGPSPFLLAQVAPLLFLNVF